MFLCFFFMLKILCWPNQKCFLNLPLSGDTLEKLSYLLVNLNKITPNIISYTLYSSSESCDDLLLYAARR